MPAYCPPTPSRLFDLIGPERETFLKGRRCENQGLGIAAFAYYRRVVERQKERIFRKVIEVCDKIGASDVKEKLQDAQKKPVHQGCHCSQNWGTVQCHIGCLKMRSNR